MNFLKPILLAAVVVCFGYGALAQQSDALIFKNSGGGFTPPEWVHYEKCEVFANKVVITRTYGVPASGGIVTVEEKPFKIQGDIAHYIAKADAEAVTKSDNGLCDGPTTETLAKKADGSWTTLYTSGGCGTPKEERNGAYSKNLQAIVDQFCPVTVGKK